MDQDSNQVNSIIQNVQFKFKIKGSDKKLSFDPLHIDFHSGGEFYVLSGTNKKASLYTREGGFLIDICEKNDWIWCAKLRSKEMFVSVSTNDGDIS